MKSSSRLALGPVLLSGLLLLPANAWASLCGDPNGSGTVTAADALIALRAAVGAEACTLDLCDFNGDGKVSASDALGILRSAVGQPVEPQCPPLIDKPALDASATTVVLEALVQHDVPVQGLVVTTLLSSDELSSSATTAQVDFVEASQGQLLFVHDAGGQLILVAFFSGAEIESGEVVLGHSAIARGVIMTHPMAVGLSREDRAELLARAEAAPGFAALVDAVGAALDSAPWNILDPEAFPQLFDIAMSLIVEAFQGAAGDAALSGSLRDRRSAPSPVVGTTNAPYFGDVPGPDIVAANPTSLFFALEMPGHPLRLLEGRQSLWELRFGWPPAASTDTVTETIPLGDGDFTATYVAYGISGTAAPIAAAANLLRFSCHVLDAIAWCPASNALIKQVLTESDLVDSLAATATDIFDDKISVSTPDKLVERMAFLLQNETVWKAVTSALYRNAADKVATAQFLEGMRSAVKLASKTLIAYDVLNVYLPFGYDLLRFRSPLDFCLKQSAGVLSSTCGSTPPVAVIKLSTTGVLLTGVQYELDASGSYDAESPLQQLAVRWAVRGDQDVYTPWSNSKTTSFVSTDPGVFPLLLEVRDPGGLIGSAVMNLVIENRYQDTGATIVDRHARLEWEKKVNLDGVANPADPHDADNKYSWSLPPYVFGADMPPDGTAFTQFLGSLGGSWRLPDRDELDSLRIGLCSVAPCIDPLFGPTRSGSYWTSTTSYIVPSTAVAVNFATGFETPAFYKTDSLFVRAVRDVE